MSQRLNMITHQIQQHIKLERFQDAYVSPKSGKVVKPTKIKGDNQNEIIAKLRKNTSSKGRYIIGYNSNDRGHVFVAERLENGEIVYYDPQKNQFINIIEYAADAIYFEILKVDKLLFNSEYFFRLITRI